MTHRLLMILKVLDTIILHTYIIKMHYIMHRISSFRFLTILGICIIKLITFLSWLSSNKDFLKSIGNL